MDKLSDDYFLSLEKSGFVTKMNIFRCDKTKLTLSSVNDNYNEFNLPNLTSLKIVDNSFEIHKTLKKLFLLNNICSRIKAIDLSNTGLTDNGMFRITKNISIFKNLESINLEQSKITTYSRKYFKQIEAQKIKLTLNEKNLEPRLRKSTYDILLAGSPESGKSSYLNASLNETNNEGFKSTIGIDWQVKNLGNTRFKIWNSCR